MKSITVLALSVALFPVPALWAQIVRPGADKKDLSAQNAPAPERPAARPISRPEQPAPARPGFVRPSQPAPQNHAFVPPAQIDLGHQPFRDRKSTRLNS